MEAALIPWWAWILLALGAVGALVLLGYLYMRWAYRWKGYGG